MKVVFVCSGNNPYSDTGGVVPFIFNQAKSLIDEKISVEFYLIKGHGIKSYLKNSRRLRQFIRNNHFDLLHAHFGFSGWVSVLSFCKIKKVVSFMGEDIYGRSSPGLKTKFKNLFIMLSSFVLQFFVDYIIVKSPNLLSYFVRRQKTQIIPNGVNLNFFHQIDKTIARKKLQFRSDKQTVLFLGNTNDPRKNFNLLEKAIVILNEKINLVTPFPANIEKIPLYLNACDVLVLSSKNEGSPNTIKEAMACNCPIVATNVGDIKWIFGETAGTFISKFNPADMAAQIRKSLEFSRVKNRTDGRKRIVELKLDNQSVARRLIDIYNNLLN